MVCAFLTVSGLAGQCTGIGVSGAWDDAAVRQRRRDEDLLGPHRDEDLLGREGHTQGLRTSW